ncbi:MAG TPA: nucleoside hydrolase, partial [bacterium]|nr:nucleoside hydrolase [bacterium]
SHPGEITLLTIGPLTNIGLLLAVDREIPFLLKRLVMMCGVFTSSLAGVGPGEWNAMGDPHATAIVYQSPVKEHYSVGLDVTCQVRLDAKEVRKKFQKPLLRVVLDMAEIWFRQRPVITFHDPLGAVALFEPEVCSFQRGLVEVELASQRLAGVTYWKPDEGGPHHVALKVKAEKFFEHFFSLCG